MKLSKILVITGLVLATLIVASCGKKGELEPPTRTQTSIRVSN